MFDTIIYYFLYLITIIRELFFQKTNKKTEINKIEEYNVRNYLINFDDNYQIIFNKRYYNSVFNKIKTFNHKNHAKYIIDAEIILNNTRRYNITHQLNSFIIPYYHFYNYINTEITVNNIININSAKHVNILLDFDDELIEKKILFDDFINIKLLNLVITCATYKNIL
jgi:hypothetical protein